MDDDETASAGVGSALDEILDQYRFHWEPEYRIKFIKEIADFRLGVGFTKPHQDAFRLRFTLKPPHHEDHQVGLGRYVQKLLVLPQQRFAAVYSRKLAWGILRFQFVAGYLWDRRRPSLDYRLSTKWNDSLRFKRKEHYQLSDNLLLRAKWNLDMQLPDVEGHLGGVEGNAQVPVDVEYGSLDFSVTQLDVCLDLDGLRDGARREDARAGAEAGATPGGTPGKLSPATSGSLSGSGAAAHAGERGGAGTVQPLAGSKGGSLPWGKF